MLQRAVPFGKLGKAKGHGGRTEVLRYKRPFDVWSLEFGIGPRGRAAAELSSFLMNPNPYAADLGNKDPLTALAATPQQIQTVVANWSDADFERSYAPGKWSARRLLAHLAQAELALGTRVRFALAQDGYTAQSFNQDDWMPLDDHMDAHTALDAYLALRQMNLTMWRNLSEEQRNRSFVHPEYGTLNVAWVAAQMAGHDIHHLRHLETIASS